MSKTEDAIKMPVIHGHRLTVEAWATKKGMLPEYLAPAPVPANTIPIGSPVNPEFVRFSAARAMCRWPEGAEVTEAEFDAAVEQATHGTVLR